MTDRTWPTPRTTARIETSTVAVVVIALILYVTFLAVHHLGGDPTTTAGDARPGPSRTGQARPGPAGAGAPVWTALDDLQLTRLLVRNAPTPQNEETTP